MNPFLVPVGEYRGAQWTGFISDLCALIVTGWDTPDMIEHRRTIWGITTDEVPAALLDAHLELGNGWGQPHQERPCES